MKGKVMYLVGFLAAVAVVASSSVVPVPAIQDEIELKANLSHNLEVGTHENGERLVLRQNVVKPSKWLQVVTVNQTFKVGSYQRITVARALDQKVNGNGATPSLTAGGPGSNYVTFLFTSKRGHSVNFVVELYAK
ncbi:probable salivary secreted peptide [Venturia canescens]|uniref:probable salivary secreted peptide n=1 Tax=Venturia canescens TaxID=32260 RepID=UPI001C9C66EE|nr:probable salivary secreted peptide [Venturia canescens]